MGDSIAQSVKKVTNTKKDYVNINELNVGNFQWKFVRYAIKDTIINIS